MTLENAKRLFEFYMESNQTARADELANKHSELKSKPAAKKASKKKMTEENETPQDEEQEE